MKITYYKYYLKNGTQRIRYNMRPFLTAFADANLPELKKQLATVESESLYLFRITEKIFLFVIIRDSEIVKAVNANDLTHEDIHDRLSSDETLGFASYIFIGKNHYGIASTFKGPKNTYWTDFINNLLQRLNIDGYFFESSPFKIESSREQVLSLEFKGATSFQVNRSSSVFGKLKELLALGDDVSTISLQIKPMPRQNMALSADSIARNLSDEGLEKYYVRGKKDLQDSATDFYILGSGSVSDTITVKGEDKICESIATKHRANGTLRQYVQEFADDNSYSQREIEAIASYSNVDSWSSVIL